MRAQCPSPTGTGTSRWPRLGSVCRSTSSSHRWPRRRPSHDLHFRHPAATHYDRPVTTDECIALTDDELVDRTYAVVDDLAESDDDRAAEAGASLIFLLGELLERYAPEVAQAELVRNLAPSDPGPLAAEDEVELLDALDGLRRRQAADAARRFLALKGADQRAKDSDGFGSRLLAQRRECRHRKADLGKCWLAFLEAALQPAHGDPRQPPRFLPRDQDRQLERLGETDPAELARQATAVDHAAAVNGGVSSRCSVS